MKIAIILGSTRPNRNGEAVARWVLQQANKRKDATFELIDLRQMKLPLLNEPIPPSQGRYTHTHTKRWSKIIADFDAYVLVTPEYNHGTSAVLKNALDTVYLEWNDKVAGFVGYGSVGGARAVEHLRLVMAELQVATVRAQVGFTLDADFKDMKVFKPKPQRTKELKVMLDQVIRWGGAFRAMRAEPESR